MKTPRIANAVGHIDDDLITEAAVSTKKTKRSPWLKWGAVAACFAVLVIAGAAALPSLLGSDGSLSGYKYTVSGSEADVEWPWEYKTNGEKYQTVNFNGREYVIKSLDHIGTESLGDAIGSCEARGVDPSTEQNHTETFEVRKLSGVSGETLIAAGNDTEFYVYILDDPEKPATFGEVLDLYGLEQNLEFKHFSVCEGYNETGYYAANDDAYIWQILSGCRDARLCSEADSSDRSERNCLTFTVTSDALGIYKQAVYIFEDGYFETNIFNYSYCYFIGEEAAAKIISYAKSNCTEAEFEPYGFTLPGTLTEIGDDYVLITAPGPIAQIGGGYVLIDDITYSGGAEGVVYKVYTDDIRMKRCVDCLNIKVGDTVAVKYEGTISENNEVSGAYSMYKGTLIKGNLAAIPE